jgi:prepilin-type N-terminal cleavage/methylation domain-containing protein
MKIPTLHLSQKAKASEGFSLVEVIVAIIILALAGTAILNSLSTNAKVDRKSTDKAVIVEALNAAAQKIIQVPIAPCSTITSNPPNPYQYLALPANVRILRIKALSPSTNASTECYRDIPELGQFASTWSVPVGSKESYQEITLCYKASNTQLCTEPSSSSTQTSDGRTKKFTKFDAISPLYLVRDSDSTPLVTTFPNVSDCSVTARIIPPPHEVITITSAAFTSATVAVFTYGGTSLVQAGQKVTIAGVTGGTYNGVWTVTSVQSPTKFTVLGSGFTSVVGTGGTFQITELTGYIYTATSSDLRYLRVDPPVVTASKTTINISPTVHAAGTDLDLSILLTATEVPSGKYTESVIAIRVGGSPPCPSAA